MMTFFGSSLDVSLAFFLGEEGTGGFADDGSSEIAPFYVSGVLFSEKTNFLAVYGNGIVIDLLDGSGESEMDGIVF
jgi:hypothetical protein